MLRRRDRAFARTDDGLEATAEDDSLEDGDDDEEEEEHDGNGRARFFPDAVDDDGRRVVGLCRLVGVVGAGGDGLETRIGAGDAADLGDLCCVVRTGGTGADALAVTSSFSRSLSRG